MTNRMPKPIIRFNSTSMQIAGLVEHTGYGKEAYPWTDRFIGKFPLPSWQRELVWTVEQNVSFIESVFMGYDLGSVMINSYEDIASYGLTRSFSDILIDGQQRVNALVSYVDNKFSVCGLYWKDLNRNERRVFLERELGKKEINCFDEEKLKQVYDHLNFSGVKHKESERAL